MATDKVLKQIHSKGVTFTCTQCGKLLRECAKHNPVNKGLCKLCGGDTKIVGIGNSMVGGAVWSKCLECKSYFMTRRGETVTTHPRHGFDKYA